MSLIQAYIRKSRERRESEKHGDSEQGGDTSSMLKGDSEFVEELEQLMGAVDEKQGVVEGRDQQIQYQAEDIDNLKNYTRELERTASRQDLRIEALYVVVETLGDKIQDLRTEKDF